MFFLTLSSHIFSALVTTRRALRIRKNIVKLSLYNHLAYALIATVVGKSNTQPYHMYMYTVPSHDTHVHVYMYVHVHV